MSSPSRASGSSLPASLPSRRGMHSLPSFEPRVIRLSGNQARTNDSCLPPSNSPSRTRRSSGESGRAKSAQRPNLVSASNSHSPVFFSRPTYLEHSALRHLLTTEPPPSSEPHGRKLEIYSHELHLTSAMPSHSDSDDESVSPTREFAPPPREEVLRLPTRWSEQCRHHVLSISTDGREISFHGNSCSGDRDAAAARTNYPIPPACGIYYYEVEILNKGQKGHISIGFAGRDVKLTRLPGWENNSWGYHGDDGCSFAADKGGSGTPYGPTFGTGDAVGCGIDFTTHRAFFTKNGTLIGPVFDGIGRDIEVYPSIGLRHSGEHVRVNFGHEPFKYDIDYHVQQQQSNIWTDILNTSLDSSLRNICLPKRDQLADSIEKSSLTDTESREVINHLVLSYLEHHGYGKTLRTFKEQLGSSSIGSIDSLSSCVSGDCDVVMDRPVKESCEGEKKMELRTKIVRSIINGNIDIAMLETQEHHPSVLQAEEGIMLFKLRCRKFVELILGAAEMKKRLRSRSSSQIIRTDEVAGGTDEVGSSMEVDEDVLALSSSSSSPSALPTMTNGFKSRKEGISIPDSNRRRSSTDWRGGLRISSVDVVAARYEAALNDAISYGQTLSKSYKDDERPEVKQIFKRTFAIVAWEDPLSAGGVISEVAGKEARMTLAHELNQAILKSQGQPVDPILETLYRHTAVCIAELGLRGQGGAAFADIRKEFLE